MDRLDAIAAFVAVADEASFVAAARRLRRSPAAVTRAVGALESRLGTRLLNRTTRAVSLTDAGLRQLEGCRRVLAEVEAIESSAASEGAGPQGLLTVTAPVVFGACTCCRCCCASWTSTPRSAPACSCWTGW
jgi:DNA-binding transcriptional LysR family regulator